MASYVRPISLLKLLLLFFTAVLVISMIVLAFTPPVSRDALIHHLAIPKLYLRHGGIYEIPFLSFSYYPMNLDLLYMIPLHFGNDIVPKFIHLMFAMLTAWLIFNYLRRRINLIYALLGVIFFLSIPIIVKLSITAYVDMGLVFFSTASLLLLIKWAETRFVARYLIFSGILCGLAAGTKYSGLITLLLLSLFVPYLYSKCAQDKRPGFFKATGFGALFLMVALMVFCPWMIRNYLWTNNPIFPLYDRLFNPQIATGKLSMGIFAYRSFLYHETWWQMVLLPVRIFFQGQDGSPQYFDGELNPFLFLLPFFAFYQIRRDPEVIRNEKKILLAFACLFFLFAFFTSTLRMRYISPILPLLVILSMFGIRRLSEMAESLGNSMGRKVGRATIVFIILFSLWLNASYILNQYVKVRPFDYLKGTLTRDEYIERHRPEYSAMRYINNNLSPDVRILFIFLGNRGYYCDREYIFDIRNNRSTLQQLLKVSASTEEFLLRLQGLGITHLLVCHDIFNRWLKEILTSEEQEFLSRFFKKYTKLLYFKNGYGVVSLNSPS
jgi:hypothetical protein